MYLYHQVARSQFPAATDGTYFSCRWHHRITRSSEMDFPDTLQTERRFSCLLSVIMIIELTYPKFEKSYVNLRAAIILHPRNETFESRNQKPLDRKFWNDIFRIPCQKFDARNFFFVGHSVYCHRCRPDTVLLLVWDELGSLAPHGVSVALHWVAMAQKKTFWVLLFS